MNIKKYRSTQTEYQTIVMKCDGVSLYICDNGGYESRNESIISLIKSAIGGGKSVKLPVFDEVVINTSDRPIDRTGPMRTLSFSTAKGFFDIAVPDFNFDAWREVGINDYESTCLSIVEAGKLPAQTKQVGWIGNCNVHKRRKLLYQIGNKYPDLLDIIDTSIWVKKAYQVRLETTGAKFLSLPNLVKKYDYLIDIEGNGYSGRVKYLLFSGRPLFLQKRRFVEWFYKDLKVWVHYIPVKNNLSDLIKQIAWAQDNPQEAADIARRAQEFALSNLTREDALKKWRKVILNLHNIKVVKGIISIVTNNIIALIVDPLPYLKQRIPSHIKKRIKGIINK